MARYRLIGYFAKKLKRRGVQPQCCHTVRRRSPEKQHTSALIAFVGFGRRDHSIALPRSYATLRDTSDQGYTDMI